MKKLLFTLLLCLILISSVQGQYFAPHQKPNLGLQVNGAHPLAPTAGWLFNEGSGNKVFDLSGNGNTGTFVNDTTWVSGKFGPALSFDGTDDYVVVPHSAIINLVQSMAIVCWVKTTSTSKGICVKQVADYEEGYQLAISGTGKIVFYIEQPDDTKREITGNTTVNDDVWHQIVAIRDYQKYIYLYVDGQNDATPVTDTLTVSISNVNDLLFGTLADGLSRLDGQIGYIMIYNRALSPSEIALLYREPFCFMGGDMPVSQMYSYAAPPAGEGQVIFIQSMLSPLILFSLFCFIKGRKCQTLQ